MRNRAVDYQFWLDIGSSGWWERLYRRSPTLTSCLTTGRPISRGPTSTNFTTRQANMRRLTLGLLRQRGVKCF